MIAFNADAQERSTASQLAKYGGKEGYAAEMRRRQALRKTKGTGGWRYMKEHDPERFKQIIAEREAKRKAKNAQERE